MHQYINHRLRHEEFLKEAERHRLISQAKRHTSRSRPIFAPPLAWWGKKLTRWGQNLQERFGDSGMVEESRVTN